MFSVTKQVNPLLGEIAEIERSQQVPKPLLRNHQNCYGQFTQLPWVTSQ
jgi:hypothetical protein